MAFVEKRAGFLDFVTNYFGSKVQIEPIEGDAGLRDYYRIFTNDNLSYIAMDCPPSYCSIQPFIFIAQYLKSHNLNAPEIYAYDVDSGFMILEDFGSVSMKQHLGQNNSSISRQYLLMTDLLIELSKKPIPSTLKEYSKDVMLSELELFAVWYIPYALGREFSSSKLAEFTEIWCRALDKLHPSQNTVMMRDYHAENVMYLSNKKGFQTLGLLDFQDAMAGPVEYDLVSFLEDARIEVPRQVALDCVSYFAKGMNLSYDGVLTNYHILGAQRNSRILGVFSRKFLRDHNDNYLQYLPLVKKYLSYDLSHSDLKELRDYYAKMKFI